MHGGHATQNIHGSAYSYSKNRNSCAQGTLILPMVLPSLKVPCNVPPSIPLSTELCHFISRSPGYPWVGQILREGTKKMCLRYYTKGYSIVVPQELQSFSCEHAAESKQGSWTWLSFKLVIPIWLWKLCFAFYPSLEWFDSIHIYIIVYHCLGWVWVKNELLYLYSIVSSFIFTPSYSITSVILVLKTTSQVLPSRHTVFAWKQ